MTIFVVLFQSLVAQDFNWANIKSDQKHILSLNTGWDHSLVYGAAYSYHIKSSVPILLNLTYSFPSGKKMLDDFKSKIGGQVNILSVDRFRFIASAHGLYRKYASPFVRLQNFGCDLKGVFGYYRSGWFLSGESGFDKAIVTHFKHSQVFEENIYADVKNGWYEPATGGNFYYGIQTGISVKNSDLILKMGKLVTQDFMTTPLVPFYAQLNLNFKFKGKKVKLEGN